MARHPTRHRRQTPRSTSTPKRRSVTRPPELDHNDPLVRLLREGKKRELPPHLRHLEHLTQRDWEESVRAQEVGANLSAGSRVLKSPHLALWRARSLAIIADGLLDKPPADLTKAFGAYLRALQEAEFISRLQESNHVRELIRRLGSDAHFIIGGLWWLLKETSSQQALLATQERPSKLRVRRHRWGQLPPADRIRVERGEEPRDLRMIVYPYPSEQHLEDVSAVLRNPVLRARWLFEAIAADHIAEVTLDRFRYWTLIGALSAEFAAIPPKARGGRDVYRECLRVRKAFAQKTRTNKYPLALDRIRETIRRVVSDAQDHLHLYRSPAPTAKRIPWRRLLRRWRQMRDGRLLSAMEGSPAERAVEIYIKEASPFSPTTDSPTEAIAQFNDWWTAQLLAGKVAIRSLQGSPTKIK